MIETWRDNNTFWNGKRALVTGGAGFLGSYVVKKLRERGCGEVFVPRSKDYDLVQLPAVQKLYADSRPDIVIHPSASLRAGSCGAGGRHRREPRASGGVFRSLP